MKKRTIKLDAVITKVIMHKEQPATMQFTNFGILDEQKCIDNALEFLGEHPELFIDKKPEERFLDLINEQIEEFMSLTNFFALENASDAYNELVSMYIACNILYDKLPKAGDLFIKIDTQQDKKFEMIISDEEIPNKINNILDKIQEFEDEDMGFEI